MNDVGAGAFRPGFYYLAVALVGGVMQGVVEVPQVYVQEGLLEGVALLQVALFSVAMLDVVHSKIIYWECLPALLLGQKFYHLAGPGVLRRISLVQIRVE